MKFKKCINDNSLINRYVHINARNKCTNYLRKAKQLYYSNLTSSNNAPTNICKILNLIIVQILIIIILPPLYLYLLYIQLN